MFFAQFEVICNTVVCSVAHQWLINRSVCLCEGCCLALQHCLQRERLPGIYHTYLVMFSQGTWGLYLISRNDKRNANSTCVLGALCVLGAVVAPQFESRIQPSSMRLPIYGFYSGSLTQTNADMDSTDVGILELA